MLAVCQAEGLTGSRFFPMLQCKTGKRPMTPRVEDISDKIDAAFREATVIAIRRAMATQTPLISWKNGKIEEISGEDLEATLTKVQESSKNLGSRFD